MKKEEEKIVIKSDQIPGLGCGHCKKTVGFTIDYRYRRVKCNGCGKKSKLDETMMFLIESERMECAKLNKVIDSLGVLLKKQSKNIALNQIILIILSIAIIIMNIT